MDNRTAAVFSSIRSELNEIWKMNDHRKSNVELALDQISRLMSERLSIIETDELVKRFNEIYKGLFLSRI